MKRSINSLFLYKMRKKNNFLAWQMEHALIKEDRTFPTGMITYEIYIYIFFFKIPMFFSISRLVFWVKLSMWWTLHEMIYHWTSTYKEILITAAICLHRNATPSSLMLTFSVKTIIRLGCFSPVLGTSCFLYSSFISSILSYNHTYICRCI